MIVDKKKKKKKKRTCCIVDFAVPADPMVKMKESEKKDKNCYLARKVLKFSSLFVTLKFLNL